MGNFSFSDYNYSISYKITTQIKRQVKYFNEDSLGISVRLIPFHFNGTNKVFYDISESVKPTLCENGHELKFEDVNYFDYYEEFYLFHFLDEEV